MGLIFTKRTSMIHSMPGSDHIAEELSIAWGAEWAALTDAERAWVVADIVEMFRDEEWPSVIPAIREHRRRVFVGNLKRYAERVEWI